MTRKPCTGAACEDRDRTGPADVQMAQPGEGGPMNRRKKLTIGILLAVSTVVAAVELYGGLHFYTRPYPAGNISGYVAWGAGGPTDVVSRALSVYGARELGTSIIIQNKTGASGSVATEFVKRQPADGYSLLFNSENPPLYKVMGLSSIDYDDYYPVILAGQQTAVLVTAADAAYTTVEALFAEALENPDSIHLATTGAGGLTSNVAAMMEAVSGVSFNQVPFDGDAAVITALLGGHADVTVINYSSAVDFVKDGSIRILTVFSGERLESEPDVPAISEVYPDYGRYFPWGTFVGVFVDDDTPGEVKATLSEAFRRGWESQGFQTFLEENHITPLGFTGEEARAYIRKWQQVTTWILYDFGQALYSPANFGLERLGEEETQ